MASSKSIGQHYPPSDCLPVPVARAVGEAKAGTGLISISPEDSCLVYEYGTCFKSEFSRRKQVMSPKSVNLVVTEVVEVLSDTEMRVKGNSEVNPAKAPTVCERNRQK